MNNISTNIWGRELNLEIIYDVYRGETVLPNQEKALQDFLSQSDALFKVALEKAKQYCLVENSKEIEEEEISNIFKYVKPKEIYVKRNSGNDKIVALICAYKFNPDDGLAIVFKNEIFLDIGSENIII